MLSSLSLKVFATYLHKMDTPQALTPGKSTNPTSLTVFSTKALAFLQVKNHNCNTYSIGTGSLYYCE